MDWHCCADRSASMMIRKMHCELQYDANIGCALFSRCIFTHIFIIFIVRLSMMMMWWAWDELWSRQKRAWRSSINGREVQIIIATQEVAKKSYTRIYMNDKRGVKLVKLFSSLSVPSTALMMMEDRVWRRNGEQQAGSAYSRENVMKWREREVKLINL